MRENSEAIFFFKSLSPFLVPTFVRERHVRSLLLRFFPFGLFLCGELSFRDFVLSLQPSNRQPARLHQFIADKIKKNIKRALISFEMRSLGGLSLFSKKIFFANDIDPVEAKITALDMIFQSIIADQYYSTHFLKRDSVVIDAGANIGMFSVSASRHVTSGSVHAFEPSSDTYQALIKNTESYGNIYLMHSALGEKKGSGTLLIQESSGGNTMKEGGLAGNIRGSEEVSVTTIDDYVSTASLRKVDFIKIDTEGYEALILKGASETIKKFLPTIVMSAYHRPEDPKKLSALLSEIAPQYRCIAKERVERVLICVPCRR